ncbi:MAG TPA: 2-oxoacid:acceptor oxidoreductase family protein [Nitrospirota bacterium]|nr:2-oxoacid:acceptor oxidoreductase family protein [Nitrospirota bacterium]
MSTVKTGKVIIPKKHKEGMYEIRLESIGGLGANVAGKIMAEAGVLGMGLNGSNFSSYGSEKKGAPVKAHVRLCDPDTPIRANSPIESPHILAIFHEALIKTVPVLQGVEPDATVLLNTTKTTTQAREYLKLHGGYLGCVDALNIAIEEKSRVNIPMLGAISKASGFINADALRDTIKNVFGKKYPQTVAGNLKAFDRGYDEVKIEYFAPDDRFPYQPYVRNPSRLGYLNQPIGGVIVSPGFTRVKDLSPSRVGFIPVLNLETCTDCGECDYACPDYCFVWEKGLSKSGKEAIFLKGIDYNYCKGCLQCVWICKPKALSIGKESDYNVDEMSVPHLFRKVK